MMYYYLVLAIVLLNGVGQVLLKMGARKGRTLDAYINPATFAGYCLFLAVTICATYALQVTELKTLYAIMSLNPLVVMMLSVLVLKETLTKNKVIAVGLIFIGLLVFNL